MPSRRFQDPQPRVADADGTPTTPSSIAIHRQCITGVTRDPLRKSSRKNSLAPGLRWDSIGLIKPLSICLATLCVPGQNRGEQDEVRGTLDVRRRVTLPRQPTRTRLYHHRRHSPAPDDCQRTGSGVCPATLRMDSSVSSPSSAAVPFSGMAIG